MKILTLSLIFTIGSMSVKSQSLYVPGASSGITGSGNSNIGVGTLYPSKKFGVLGDISLEQNGTYLFGKDASGSLQPLIGINGYSTIIKGKLHNEIKIETSGDGEVHIIGNRIGLGTSNPEKELGVAGNIALQSYNSFLYAKLAQPVGSLQPLIGVEGLNTVIKGRENHEIKIEAAGDGEVHILANKVGIATTTMGNHRLAVEGSIGAREIKVEANGWSDFVFEKDYELRTLEEVEKYIAEKGHLPEIPSKAEVTEDGINLGEMNAKLLQKIEELTLYLIEQDKKLDAQQKEIKELKSQIKN